MKKISLFIFANLICLSLSAQRYMRRFDQDVYPITYGLMGGLTVAGLNVTSPDNTDMLKKTKFAPSFGINLDFRLSENFSIRPGVMFAGKGGSANGSYTDALGATVFVNNDYSLNYLEVPLNLLAHIPFGDDASLFFGGGPFVGYGLNGTNSQTIGSDTQKQNVYFGAGGDFNKADYGATAVLGYQAESGLAISGNLDFGLKNILLNNNTGYNVTGIKTVAFYITIGHTF